MSPQMLKRVHLWEQQSTTNLNPPAASATPTATPTSGVTPSPRTSTPITSSQVEEGTKIADVVRRFPFQQKTVPQVRVMCGCPVMIM